MAENKIGVLGGTFDPVHNGHLVVAEELGRKLGLEEVLFVPAGQPWMKEGTAISPAEHRLEMLLLATASNPRFNVSTIELERDGPTYSVDTIAELKDSLSARTGIYVMVGFDALAELPRWKEPGRLLEMCQVVGFRRPGHEELDMRALNAAVPGAPERIMIVDVPAVDISATEIRRRVSRGLSISNMVPEEVERYIAENGLYR